MNSEFLVLDVDPSYRAILGRPWLEQIQGIPSTTHQCFKFPYNGRIFKIRSIPTMETLNAITSEQMPFMTIHDKGKRPVMSIVDTFLSPTSLALDLKSVVRHRSLSQPRGKGWQIMLNMGFSPGQGLGKNEQGPLSIPKIKVSRNKRGLGSSEDQAQPVGAISWNLHMTISLEDLSSLAHCQNSNLPS